MLYGVNLDSSRFVPAEYTDFGKEITDEYDVVLEQLKSGEKTGRPIEIEKPRIPEDVPTFKQLVEKYRENSDLLYALIYLYQYISTPIILDGFGSDDEARTEWEKDVQRKFTNNGDQRGDFALTIVNQNKLRLNSLNNVNYSLQILMFFEDENFSASSFFNRLRPEIKDTDQYKKLDIDQKKEVAKETTELVYEVLRTVYQKIN